MSDPISPLDRQFQSIRIVYYFMFGSLFLYMYLSEFLLHPPVHEIGTFYQVTIVVCVIELILGIVLRKVFVDRAAEALRANPDDLTALAKGRIGLVATFGLAEAASVFMSLWSPKRPS